ncbi:LacI family DNA-binding transcriptional regulator [Microbacteriaceae bacterium VKM Ac-2855]|nr:LacI family DNA-binding transcriptional regulator [Microbacteriaceae bacterium VKM Ac-2855]
MSSDDATARGGSARRPTIQDVAEAAGVSRALVSIVFRDVPGASAATRARVRGVADELGYRPDRRAQLLRQSRSRTLGVSFAVHDTFHAELVAALYRTAAELGYALTLSASTEDRPETVSAESLLAERPEAIVLLGSSMTTSGLDVVSGAVPTVVVTRPADGIDSVHTDDREGGRLAASHLFGLGHRSLCYLNAPGVAGADARLLGVHDAASDAGVGVQIIDAGNDEEAGVRASSILLERAELPTAIFAFNDRCAIGVLDTFIRAGVRIPEDVSLIGYDDSRMAGISVVALTTIAQDAAGLARRAVELAIDRVADESLPVREAVLAPTLVVRSTTATPRDDEARPVRPSAVADEHTAAPRVRLS